MWLNNLGIKLAEKLPDWIGNAIIFYLGQKLARQKSEINRLENIVESKRKEEEAFYEGTIHAPDNLPELIDSLRKRRKTRP